MTPVRLMSMVIAGVAACTINTAFAADAVIKSVADLYAEKAALVGKQVQVSGKVVKVNNGIMNRNFLHVQDGTGAEGANDLTITSQQTAAVGDQVTATGKVSTDVDFGMGYKYPLLMEEAALTAATPAAR